MKKELFQTRWTFIAGALLAFPALYFVIANILNFELGISWLYRPIESIFENPTNKSFGWNVNMLIVFGPLLAIALNALSLFYIKTDRAGEYFHVQLFIKRRWWNITVLILAAATLLCLFGYLFFENMATAR